MNPMYLAFCKAHGRTPKQQMDHDQKRWPGGIMTGYILWIQDRKKEFFDVSPESFIGPDRIVDLMKWQEFVVRRGAEMLAVLTAKERRLKREQEEAAQANPS